MGLILARFRPEFSADLRDSHEASGSVASEVLTHPSKEVYCFMVLTLPYESRGVG
jgi:hypothetical protein